MNLYQHKLHLAQSCLSHPLPNWIQIIKLFESLEAFTQFLDDQGTIGLCYKNLANHHSDWPQEVINRIEKLAAQDCLVDAVRQAEVDTVFKFISDSGIPCLVIKGESLSRNYYDESHLRSRIDVDIWVDSPQFNNIAKIFATQGYTIIPTLKIHNERVFKKTNALGVDIIFDLHTKISNRALFASLLPFDEVWAQSLPLNENESTLRRPNSAYELLLACLHPVFHHANWGRLIWFYDTKLIIENMSANDSQQFFDIIHRKKMKDLCQNYIASADRYCPINGDKRPFLNQLSLIQADKSDKYIAKYKSWWGLILEDFKLQKGSKAKVLYLQQILLPDIEYMTQKYNLNKKRYFLIQLFATYVLRAAYGIKRKVLFGSQS